MERIREDENREQLARFTVYRGAEHGELFDLRRDPQGLNNLFGRPEGAELRAHLTESVALRLMEVGDEAPRPMYMA